MTFNKTFLPLLLAATLAATPAYAFDSSDPFGVNGAQAATKAYPVGHAPICSTGMPVSGGREEYSPRTFGQQLALNGAAGFALGVADVALATPVGGVALPFLVIAMDKNYASTVSLYYSGTIARGKVIDVEDGSWGVRGRGGIAIAYGLADESIPTDRRLDQDTINVKLDANGGKLWAQVPKSLGVSIGDVVDAKYMYGRYFFQDGREKYPANFNKHVPRVISLVCGHDDVACKTKSENELGVYCRHQDKEFPPSQYLIDPAIIAADQAKMRKEAEESKAASNSGGFSFM